MRIRYVGHFGTMSGYSLAGYDYLSALKRHIMVNDLDDQLDIYMNAQGKLDLIPNRFKHLVDNLHSQGADWPTHCLIQSVIEQAPEFLGIARQKSPNAKMVLLTAWETDSVPDRALEALKAFDLVLVPSTWNFLAFTEHNILDNVRLLPHCYDPSWWSIPRKARHTGVGDELDVILEYPLGTWNRKIATSYQTPYIFYAIQAFIERKNALGLLKAYLTAFTPEDKVLLKLVTGKYDKDDLHNFIRGLGLNKLPQVEILQNISDEELRNLHLTSDCYVTLSRGEGWNLGAFEAALVGNPVIASMYGGHTDFLLHYPNTFFVPCYDTPVITPPTKRAPKQFGGLQYTPIAINAPMFTDATQLWGEPDIRTAKQLMRLTYETCYQTAPDYDTTLKTYDYATVGRKLYKLLETLC